MILLVRCPRCRHNMNYQTRENILTGKVKACVYCGKQFKVRENIIRFQTP